MGVILLNWLLSALGLMCVAYLVPGFQVRGLDTALIAALVVGLVNATLGFVLKIVTLPLSIVTFGIFLVVINALMLRFAAVFVPGFVVHGFGSAFMGAIILSLISLVFRSVFFGD
jgi:putative membrane protein